MNLTRLAVDRPVTTLMCCLIVVLLGAISLMRLPIDMMPDMTYPTVSVSTLYAGSGPEEVETLITRPLERALASVTGVEKVDSTSAEGSSSIRVRFRWGHRLVQREQWVVLQPMPPGVCTIHDPRLPQRHDARPLS